MIARSGLTLPDFRFVDYFFQTHQECGPPKAKTTSSVVVLLDPQTTSTSLHGVAKTTELSTNATDAAAAA
jgi:hypothetical protein